MKSGEESIRYFIWARNHLLCYMQMPREMFQPIYEEFVL